jgi:hypothetical protein
MSRPSLCRVIISASGALVLLAVIPGCAITANQATSQVSTTPSWSLTPRPAAVRPPRPGSLARLRLPRLPNLLRYSHLFAQFLSANGTSDPTMRPSTSSTISINRLLGGQSNPRNRPPIRRGPRIRHSIWHCPARAIVVHRNRDIL